MILVAIILIIGIPLAAIGIIVGRCLSKTFDVFNGIANDVHNMSGAGDIHFHDNRQVHIYHDGEHDIYTPYGRIEED